MKIISIIDTRKRLFLLIILFMVINTSIAFADFYVIAGSRGVGKEIKSLPYTISSPGFYYITKDLSCVAGSYGIEITVDNVTLDLMGFSLVGPGGTSTYSGIYMNLITNVEIRNGTVRNFAYHGIENSAGTGHRIINVRVKDNKYTGLQFYGNSHLIERCTAANNGDYGIRAGDSSIVIGNICYDNFNSGIYAGVSSTVTSNTCYSNGSGGIWANAGCTITGNTCNDNTTFGIFTGHSSTVIGNACYSNDTYGIDVDANCFIDQNTANINTTKNIADCPTCTFGQNHAPSP